ncbi:MAG TPA: hypothetical protein VF743_02080, partial [Acidimicrobiales bacterium]
MRGRHHDGHRRRPVVRATLVAATALGAALVAGAADASSRRQPVPGAVERLQDEVDAMVEAGVPADDPKVEMMQEEVDA